MTIFFYSSLLSFVYYFFDDARLKTSPGEQDDYFLELFYMGERREVKDVNYHTTYTTWGVFYLFAILFIILLERAGK